MQDLIKKRITVSGVESKSGEKNGKQWTMIMIKDGEGNKYSFFTKKIDGNETKSFEGYKKIPVVVGSDVNVAFSETPKSFTNKEGKEVNYKLRNIAFFGEVSPEQEAPIEVESFGTQNVETPF